MNLKHKYILFLIAALLLTVTSACSTPEPAGLTDDQVTTIAENALKALDAGDYSTFSQDFSDDMKAAFTETQFSSLQTMLQTASGKFISLEAPSLTNNQGYAIYRFPAKYEQETVYVTITFKTGGDKVEGFFFDSPNLREQPK